MSSEINSIESSPATTPVHIIKNDLPSNIAHSFSNMDMSSPTNRNLSEKELRDCDVIGMYTNGYDWFSFICLLSILDHIYT